MARSTWPTEVALWISHWTALLHETNGWRLSLLLGGMLFARGRMTVASWLRAGELGDDFRGYYYFLGSLGRKVKSVAGALLRLAVQVINPGERLLFAIDDSPTKRYGPKVEGAGIHHNPTPGPAHQEFLYGHSWVTIGLALRHPQWGTICLPLLAKLYIRAKDIVKLVPGRKLAFKTKLELGVMLVGWAAACLA